MRVKGADEEAAGWVYYEIENLVEATKILEQLPEQKKSSPAEKVQRNIATEAFLIHFRNLSAFFYSMGNMYPDDVVADQFLPSWGRPKPPPTVASEMPRIHKRVAHLSYQRRSLPKKWQYLVLADPIRSDYEKFRKRFAADEPQHAGWFEQAPPLPVVEQPALSVTSTTRSYASISVISMGPHGATVTEQE